MLFPSDVKSRKEFPVFTGAVMYFPRALAAVSHVSFVGNEQHNPGEPLHWARGKSTDQLDAALRHIMEYSIGETFDDKGYHVLAQAAWRVLAELELHLEAAEAAKESK